jgi:hypothetical protein
MAQTTRFNGTWNITGIDPTSNVNMTMNTLTVNGDFKVIGTTANIQSTDTAITDRIITLNQGETGYGVTGVHSGIEIDRGLSPKTALRWNESTGQWQVTNDGSTYLNILAAPPGSVVMTHLIEDTAPQLGGNLDVLARSIFSSNVEVVPFDTNVAIKNTTIAPSITSGYNTVYAQTPSSGGSGLYITNDTNQQQELVTKTKAIVFALIM